MRLLLKYWAIGELTAWIADEFIKGWKDLPDKRLRAYVVGHTREMKR